MKKEKFNRLFKGIYNIKDDCLNYKNEQLCNFYIKKISINPMDDANISFTVKLKSYSGEEERTLPIMYWDSPYIWLKSEFDMEKFQICVSKDEYEKHINEIIKFLVKSGMVKICDLTPGWNINTEIAFKPYDVKFYKYDDLDNVLEYEYEKHDYIKEYIDLIDKNISVPLFAYLLASTLSSINFIPKEFDRKFVVSLTGGKIRSRERVALMFANVHNRFEEFCLAKQYFLLHHLSKIDSTGEILHKAKVGKDSVVIAFEPNRNMCRYIKKVFIDNYHDYEIQSNCLITTRYVEEIPFETLNIDIPFKFDEKIIDDYFRNEDYEDVHCDHFTENIYYFIGKLYDNINNDDNIQKYLRKKYIKFRNNISCDNFKELSDNAYNIAVRLCFAYELYMQMFKSENYTEDFRCIVAAVKKSFPTDDEERNKQFRRILKICCAVDNYFNESKHKKYMLGLNEIQTCDIVKLKYDEKHLYMRADVINEILRIENFPGNFSVDIKKLLAEENLIDSYFKQNGRREYSVHLPNSKIGANKIQTRYIAFNREECRMQQLFPKIEGHIFKITSNKLSNSCQNE